MAVACLHTAASNIAIFDDAACKLNIPAIHLSHLVVPHWLAEAERAGGLTVELKQQLVSFIQSIMPHFDAVLITCSTLGAVAENFPCLEKRCAVYRTDQMLADALGDRPGKSVVLYAAPSTLATTTALFCRDTTRLQPEVRLVSEAWQIFKSGDQDSYLALIAEAIKKALDEGADNVALAQVSMAPAIKAFTGDARVLASPHLSLQRCFG